MLERHVQSLIRRQIPTLLSGGSMGAAGGSFEQQPSFAVDFSMGTIRSQAAAPTFTRATTATVVDHDQVVRAVQSGEVRFQGLRRVQNLLTTSEAFTTAGSWTNVSTITTSTGINPFGSNSTITKLITNNGVTTNGNDGNGGTTCTVTPTATTPFVAFSIFAKAAEVTALRLREGTTTGARFKYDLVAGTVTQEVSGFNCSGTITSYGNGWYRCTIYRNPSSITGAQTFNVKPGLDTGDGASGVLIWGAQFEAENGRTVTQVSEYVSAGVLSTPYQGANVDGVRCFPWYNGNVVQQNMMVRSQDLSTTWTTSNCTIGIDQAVAPDGTMTADAIVEDGTTSVKQVLQNISGLVLSQYYTFSAYIKASTRSQVQLLFNTSFAPAGNGNFDLSTGQVLSKGANISNASITPVGNGWYRCVITGQDLVGGAINVFISSLSNGVSNYTGTNGAQALYVWGAQLQPGRRASTYVATTSAAINNNIVEEQQGDWIPTTTRLGYLAEGGRTNIALQSQDLTTVTWTKTRTTAAVGATAPDGSATASQITEDSTATSTHAVQETVSSTTNSSPLTFSVWAQAAGRTNIQLEIASGTTTTTKVDAPFNLTAGTAGAVVNGGTAASSSSTITAFPNGWYRCTVTTTLTNAETSVILTLFLADGTGNITYSGNGASGVRFWGAQLEQASFASSYIPTTTVAFVRNPEVLSYPNSVIDPTKGTLVCGVNATLGVTGVIAANNNLTVSSSTALFQSLLTDIRCTDGTNTAIKSSLPSDSGTIQKYASSWGAAGLMVTGAGQTPATNATFTGTMNQAPNFTIGCQPNNGNTVYGCITSFAYYPFQVTAAQLQRLTR